PFSGAKESFISLSSLKKYFISFPATFPIPQLHLQVEFRKLSVKYIVYLHPTKLYREQSLKMFEDTNRHILKHPRLSVKSKLLYYLAINRCDFVVDLFVGSYNWIKNR
ncbi:MAG: hypothetical protein SNI66_08960, partial [Rikenellaceae bacterium]